MDKTITEIYKDRFKLYEEVFENEIPRLVDNKARVLLENSLYLSVFTAFEDFLKQMIDSYIFQNTNKLKCEELVPKIASCIFFSQKRNFENVEVFRKFCEYVNEPLKEETLRIKIHFKYLHADVLDDHYNSLFEQILGMPFYLNKLTLHNKRITDPSLCVVENTKAIKFLRDFTSRVRNNIAHSNDMFVVTGYSFKNVTDAFLQIMIDIESEYINKNIQTINAIKHNELSI